MTGSVAARLALALIAALVLAWVGVLLRNLELGDDATLSACAGVALSPAERDRAAEPLHRAQLLGPNARWELARGGYYLLNGRPQTAAMVAEGLLGEEPENVAAWALLREATRRTDPGRSERAAAEIRRLDPLGAPLLGAGLP